MASREAVRLVGRRDVLRTGAFAAGLVGLAAVAGCGAQGPSAPQGGRVEQGTLTSRHWPSRQVGWHCSIPARPTGVVVALHGRGGSASDILRLAGDGIAEAGSLAVVGLDGAESYWHRRRTGPQAGSDSGALVFDDLLPLVAGLGVPTEHVGFTGLSMGGYGALLLATQLPARRVIGCAAVSAALWTRAADTAPGAFDDAADYRSHDVFARVPMLRALPVRLACGDRDPFIAANRALARRLPSAQSTFGPGGHDDGYWSQQVPMALRFLSGQTA